MITGHSGNGATDDYYTAKYAAADGALLWEKRYDGSAPMKPLPGRWRWTAAAMSR